MSSKGPWKNSPERGGVGDLLAGAGAHEVDDVVVLVLLGPSVGDLAYGLSGVLGALEDAVEALDHLVVVVIALDLLQDLQRHGDGVAHLLGLGGVVGLEAVNDRVVDALGERGAGGVGDCHDGSAGGLGDLVGLDGLGGATAERAGDHKGVGAEPGRRVEVELVGREELDVERLGVVGEEVLGRVELGHRGPAADKGDGINLVVGQDVGDDLLGLVEVDLVHVLPFLSPLARAYGWVGVL